MTDTQQTNDDLGELVRNFNMWDTSYDANPYPVLSRLQAECPVARSEALGGYWFVTSYEGVHDVFSNPAVFSSRNLTVPPLEEPLVLIPETIDPPEHTAYRRIFTPLFSPARMRLLEESARATARSLMEAFVADGGGDFMKAVAVPLPSTVFLDLLGLPKSDLDRLLMWKDAIMRDLIGDDPVKSEYAKTVMMPEFFGYFQQAVDARRAMEDPPEDVLTGMIEGQLPIDGGRTMTDAEITNTLLLFVLAGLDTVTAALALSVESLATNPSLRQQLLDSPAVIPNAVEELLRYWSLVTTCRQANEDAVVGGQQIKAGDYVAVCTAAASRDPSEFENPHEIDFGRTNNRHLAFGAGPHRCLGSHLARMEMAIAIEELLRVLPSFGIAPGTTPKHHFGGVLGCDELFLVAN